MPVFKKVRELAVLTLRRPPASFCSFLFALISLQIEEPSDDIQLKTAASLLTDRIANTKPALIKK